jgi:hypothetical protein
MARYTYRIVAILAEVVGTTVVDFHRFQSLMAPFISEKQQESLKTLLRQLLQPHRNITPS